MEEYTCGSCGLCVKGDGTPYCIVKDLYTEVKLTDVCNAKDSKGRLMYVKEMEWKK